jgi:hypothetical protein
VSERLPPFDPLRALGDVQRQAIDSANQVIDQFLDLARSPEPGPRAGSGSADGVGADGDGDGGAEPGFHQLRADMARALDVYVDLLRRTFDSYADLAEATLRRRPAGAGSGNGTGPGDPGGGGALTLTAIAGVAEGPLWLHNTTGAEVAPDPVRPTALTAHGGAEIRADRVTIDPPTLPAVAAHGSAGAVVRVDARGVPPGRYAGHLLTSRAALALYVEVPG